MGQEPKLTPQEHRVLQTWRALTSFYKRSAYPIEIARAVSLTPPHVSMVLTHLIRKGVLERVSGKQLIERGDNHTQLEGTSRDRLTLHLEFMGPAERVLEDVNEAIERLQWFKAQMEQKIAQEKAS